MSNWPFRPSSRVFRSYLFFFCAFLILGAGSRFSLAVQEASERRDFKPLNRFPRMVHEYFVQQLRELEEKANQRREGLSTRADAEAYVRSVRNRIQQSFGPWPEKTPLNPRITGVVERDGYRIENIIFESRPGFLVTANLYVPEGRTFPLPGVVGTCGHSSNGKAEEAYQSFAQGLARMGYVVLLYDPISQGERLQYTNENLVPPFLQGRFMQTLVSILLWILLGLISYITYKEVVLILFSPILNFFDKFFISITFILN